MNARPLTDAEFVQFQRFIHDRAGISLSAAKKALVSGRLAKRLAHCQVATYGQYLGVIAERSDEAQVAVDLLTTNETYFFREPKHFDFLRTIVASHTGPRPFRVWSAASSSGEEAYSIAMVLEDLLPGQPWEVVGTDISQRVLERARRGHYPMLRAQNIPADYLQRFCLKGHGEQEGTLLVEKALRHRVQFTHANLNTKLPSIGTFDVIFLRNVLIYFDATTKRSVVARVLTALKPGGWLLIGHSESLHDVTTAVRAAAPATYQKL